MQNAALDQILAAQRGRDGSPFKDGGTRDQLHAYLAEHPDADGLAPYGGVKDRIILTDMAAAKDAFGVLGRASEQRPGQLRQRSPSSS